MTHPQSSALLPRMSLALALLLMLLGVAPLPPARAATILTINAGTADDDSPGDGCTLREAIDLANAGMEPGGYPNGCTVKGTMGTSPVIYQINLSAYTYTLASTTDEDDNADGDLDIAANVIIMGQNTPGATVIDGDGIDRVFHIDPGGSGSYTVQIVNTTVQNGSAHVGGGIAVSGENDALILEDSIVYDNVSAWNGGGIYNDGTLTLTDSEVYSNTSTAIAARGGGGIYNGGRLNVTDSDIYSNTLTGHLIYGGGICNYGTLAINGGTLSHNDAGEDGGGGLANDGIASLTGVTIANNTALDPDDDDDGYGGGIETWGAITITNCTIYGNEADDGGGGIYSGIGLVTDGTATITGTTIYSNTTSGDGGGINNTGALTITHSRVLTNSAGSNGGGIHSAGGLYLASSTVVSNTAGVYGGGMRIYADEGDTAHAIITDTIVSRNTAGDECGGVLLRAHDSSTVTLTLDQSTISENKAGSYGGGFEVWLSNGGVAEAALVDSDIMSNTAGSDDGGGIEIWASSGSTATVSFDRVDISGNNAGTNGGGAEIYASSTSAAWVTFNDSTISSNDAGSDGGGIYNEGGMVDLNNSSLSGNTSGDDGGGIYSDGESVENPLTLSGCTVSGNTANSDSYIGGGGIYLYYSTLAMTNTTISSNAAITTHGGGIGTLSDSDQTIDLAHCTIYSNTSGGNGGGLFLEESFTVNTQHTIVAGNAASGEGPDIHGVIVSQDYNLIQDTSAVTITGVTAHNILGENPLLGPLADNGGETWTHALLEGSPAIDTVPITICTMTIDQRGVSRPQGPACDIGAFELAPLSCYTLTMVTDPLAGGSVSADPAPNCGEGEYTEGTVVTLTAEASAGYAFCQWSGDTIGSANPVTVTMDGDLDVTAHFNWLVYLPLLVRMSDV